MSKKIVSVVFIGAGNIATQHMSYLKEFPDVKIFGVYDINQEILFRKQRELGIEVFSSLDQMLDNTKPDAAFICIPPYSHGESEIACIKRRIPFLVEKPLARNIDIARRIASEVKDSGIITSAAYMNRYRYGVQEAKKFLEKFPITMVHGGWVIDTPKRDHPWLMQKELSGGQMVEQTTHLFDLVRYLCGEMSSIHCYGTKGFISTSDRYNTDDATGVLIKLNNGAFASILSSWSSGLENKIYLNLSGPNISIQLTNWELDARILLRDSSNPIIIPGERNIFGIEDRAFINAIKSNNPAEILSDYSDGVRSLEISVAANESLKYGNPVRLGVKNATFS